MHIKQSYTNNDDKDSIIYIFFKSNYAIISMDKSNKLAVLLTNDYSIDKPEICIGDLNCIILKNSLSIEKQRS